VLADSTFTWESAASDRVRLYYQPDTFADRHRFMILRSVTRAVENVVSVLEEPEYEGTLRAFYVTTREEMTRIMGRPVAGYSDWGGNAIYIVLNPEWRSFEVHEFTHVVTMGVWGSPHDTCGWMVEGIANSVDGWCQEYAIDEVVLRFLDDEDLPSLAEYFRNYADLGEIRAGFYGASFIGFLRDRYGAGVVRDLWREGTAALPDLTGENLDTLETAWKSYLRAKIPNPGEVDLEGIDEMGCG
jgi:hypothetical protein